MALESKYVYIAAAVTVIVTFIIIFLLLFAFRHKFGKNVKSMHNNSDVGKRISNGYISNIGEHVSNEYISNIGENIVYEYSSNFGKNTSTIRENNNNEQHSSSSSSSSSDKYDYDNNYSNEYEQEDNNNEIIALTKEYKNSINIYFDEKDIVIDVKQLKELKGKEFMELRKTKEREEQEFKQLKESETNKLKNVIKLIQFKESELKEQNVEELIRSAEIELTELRKKELNLLILLKEKEYNELIEIELKQKKTKIESTNKLILRTSKEKLLQNIEALISLIETENKESLQKLNKKILTQLININELEMTILYESNRKELDKLNKLNTNEIKLKESEFKRKIDKINLKNIVDYCNVEECYDNILYFYKYYDKHCNVLGNSLNGNKYFIYNNRFRIEFNKSGNYIDIDEIYIIPDPYVVCYKYDREKVYINPINSNEEINVELSEEEKKVISNAKKHYEKYKRHMAILNDNKYVLITVNNRIYIVEFNDYGNIIRIRTKNSIFSKNK